MDITLLILAAIGIAAIGVKVVALAAILTRWGFAKMRTLAIRGITSLTGLPLIAAATGPSYRGDKQQESVYQSHCGVGSRYFVKGGFGVCRTPDSQDSNPESHAHCGKAFLRNAGKGHICPQCTTDHFQKGARGWQGANPVSNELCKAHESALLSTIDRAVRRHRDAERTQKERLDELGPNGKLCDGCSTELTGAQTRWCRACASGSARAKRGRDSVSGTWRDRPEVSEPEVPETKAEKRAAKAAKKKAKAAKKAAKKIKKALETSRSHKTNSDSLCNEMHSDELCESCSIDGLAIKGTRLVGHVLLCQDCAEIVRGGDTPKKGIAIKPE